MDERLFPFFFENIEGREFPHFDVVHFIFHDVHLVEFDLAFLFGKKFSKTLVTLLKEMTIFAPLSIQVQHYHIFGKNFLLKIVGDNVFDPLTLMQRDRLGFDKSFQISVFEVSQEKFEISHTNVLFHLVF